MRSLVTGNGTTVLRTVWPVVWGAGVITAAYPLRLAALTLAFSFALAFEFNLEPKEQRSTFGSNGSSDAPAFLHEATDRIGYRNCGDNIGFGKGEPSIQVITHLDFINKGQDVLWALEGCGEEIIHPVGVDSEYWLGDGTPQGGISPESKFKEIHQAIIVGIGKLSRNGGIGGIDSTEVVTHPNLEIKIKIIATKLPTEMPREGPVYGIIVVWSRIGVEKDKGMAISVGACGPWVLIQISKGVEDRCRIARDAQGN